ncbi:Uncharacterised protein [Cedecea neteri]|uniref:Uncharacterized protein n=1 Tax=Cedecea neteri TaxID=158822 RepID=A0A2X2V8G7_9ENTR|nr:Uncharacterised protein [Cedecea neteri]
MVRLRSAPGKCRPAFVRAGPTDAIVRTNGTLKTDIVDGGEADPQLYRHHIMAVSRAIQGDDTGLMPAVLASCFLAEKRMAWGRETRSHEHWVIY